MDEAPLARTCLQCSQPLAADAETCPTCGRDGANPFTPPATPIERPIVAEGDPRLYGAVAAVLAVSMVVSFVVPGLGIPLGIVLLPAAVRAAAVLKRQQSSGSSPAGQIGFLHALLTSAGVTFLVWLASAITFTIICFPLGLISFDLHTGPGVGLIAGVVLGFSAGLAVFVWLTRRFWPRVEKN